MNGAESFQWNKYKGDKYNQRLQRELTRDRDAIKQVTGLFVTNWLDREPIYDDLVFTEDHDLIKQTLAGTDSRARYFLLENLALSDDEMVLLAQDDDVKIREALAQRSNLPEEALSFLWNDSNDMVRLEALCNPLTQFPDYVRGVLEGRFSLEAKKMFAYNSRSMGDIKVFEFLWESKSLRGTLMFNLTRVVEAGERIDPKVFSVVHSEARNKNASKEFRIFYAGAKIALPEILDELKDDLSKDVVRCLANNSIAWPSTHEYLAERYKIVGAIRTNIALATTNNQLLNKLYNETKSKKMRSIIAQNPAFTFVEEMK